jgi:hypothetical protein
MLELLVSVQNDICHNVLQTEYKYAVDNKLNTEAIPDFIEDRVFHEQRSEGSSTSSLFPIGSFQQTICVVSLVSVDFSRISRVLVGDPNGKSAFEKAGCSLSALSLPTTLDRLNSLAERQPAFVFFLCLSLFRSVLILLVLDRFFVCSV